jgi:hypothetical protein
VSVRREARHDLARTAEGPHGHAATDDLTECRQIGNDAGELGDTAPRQPEPGDDFVENQQGAVLLGNLAQGLKEFFSLQQQAVIRGHRLDDDGGDARTFFCE